MSIEELVQEARRIIQRSTWMTQMLELDRTDHAVKLRLIIDTNLFIQVYFNSLNGTTNFVLVNAGQRIFGRDCMGGGWHKHPFENPAQHDIGKDGGRSVTLTEFAHEVEQFLIQESLL